MMSKPWRSTCFAVVAMLFFCTWILTSEALGARAGGGRSIGSRGSRTTAPPKAYTAPQTTQPSRPGLTPTSPGATTGPRTYTPPPTSQPTGGFWRSVGGGLLGGLAGGFLYRSLFGGPSATATPGSGGAAGSSGSSFGLMDILLLGGIAFMIYYFIKSRRREAVAEGPGPSQYASEAAQPALGGSVQPPYYDQPALDQDLEKGLANIRQYDPSFDEYKFKEQVMDIFFKVQGAWASHDMSAVKANLTDEMFRLLQEDSNRLKQDGRINKLESVAVRSADITEAWQEAGQDYLTVRLLASLLDYTVDAKTGDVLEGSKTEPVKFEEYWTFTRPVGGNAWQLSAISQPA